MAKQTLPGGSTMEYAYDPLMRLKSILAKDPAQNPVITREYTYSPIGNITAKDTEHGDYSYAYDELYRLTNETNPTNGANGTSYTYDAIGNRLTMTGVDGNWTYNSNNELTAYGDTTFQYDANGNQTNKTNGTTVTNYAYDVADRLVQVKDGAGGVIADYYYDPFGRRLWKEVDGVRTYFLYSEEGLIGEYDASGQEITAYGWAPDSIWGTDPLFVKTGGEYYWYQNDHQGTPQKIVDTSGRVVWSATYDAFGNCQIGIEEIINNLRLAGQYCDAETGLHYNWHRYYDPQTGRYLQSDPLGDGLNLYAYCFNNPHTWFDPEGLCIYRKISEWIHIGLSAAGFIPVLGFIPDLIDAFLYLLEGEWVEAGISAFAAIPLIGDIGKAGRYAYKGAKLIDAADTGRDITKATKRVSIHHIATNKNLISTARGGPWTPRFEKIFEKAGMTLEDAANKIGIPGHFGPHPEAYHQAVFDRLVQATEGLSGDAYKAALEKELEAIGREATTAGTTLNKLLTEG